MKIFYLNPKGLDLLSAEFRSVFSPARRQQIADMTHPGAMRDAAAAELVLHGALSFCCPDYRPPLDYARDERGKPYFPDGRIQFSLSHAGGCAACGISPEPVGVDLEFRRDFPPLLLEKIACPGDAALPPLFLWTAKEAVMKLTGMGLSLRPGRIRVTERAAYLDGAELARLHFFPVEGGVIAAASCDEAAEYCEIDPEALKFSVCAKNQS